MISFEIFRSQVILVHFVFDIYLQISIETELTFLDFALALFL